MSETIQKRKLGLIINPVAGMGGSVGLKGTDHVVEEAVRRGAVPCAALRVEAALSKLLPMKDQIEIYTCPGPMGGDLAEQMGFSVFLLEGSKKSDEAVQTDSSKEMVPLLFSSTGADTRRLAEELKNRRMDLILFAGGDGTARDLYEAVGLEAAVLGIPAGVKIHSPVFAKTPKDAGRLSALWLTGKVKKTRAEEVLDIDEEQYRKEVITTRLFGYLTVPNEETLVQSRKAPTPLSELAAIESIAHQVVEDMEEDTYYLIGAGTTTRGIMYLLNLKNTLIGVDLVYNRELIKNDIYGDQILSYIKGKKAKLVVTVTGGQGFLFGRGNQQLTPAVIREIGRENMIILAAKAKLCELRGRPLLVDTPDQELNAALCGFYKTITAYGEFTVCRVSDG